jgi:hypothetical protein
MNVTHNTFYICILHFFNFSLQKIQENDYKSGSTRKEIKKGEGENGM